MAGMRGRGGGAHRVPELTPNFSTGTMGLGLAVISLNAPEWGKKENLLNVNISTSRELQLLALHRCCNWAAQPGGKRPGYRQHRSRLCRSRSQEWQNPKTWR